MINTIAPVNSAKIGRIAAPSPSGAVKVAAKRTVVRAPAAPITLYSLPIKILPIKVPQIPAIRPGSGPAPEAIESAIERAVSHFFGPRVFTVVTDGRKKKNFFKKKKIKKKGGGCNFAPPPSDNA